MTHGTPTVLGQFGRFVIQRELGEGQFAVVYQARDRQTGQSVALKLLKDADRLDQTQLARFKREFSILSHVKHDNLVRLYELFLDEDCYFTMELVEGSDLIAYVRSDLRRPSEPGAPRRSMPLAFGEPVQEMGQSAYTPCTPAGISRLRRAFSDLASAVGAIHDAGLVHRDLRPHNVRVTPRGRTVLLDYGLVTHLGLPDDHETGEMVGTAAYMAPEQWDRASSGPASDWYAVGVMLFEALTGSLPFSGSAQAVFVRKRTVGAPRPSLLVGSAHVPAQLDDLCAALLGTDPAQRPDRERIVLQLRADSG